MKEPSLKEKRGWRLTPELQEQCSVGRGEVTENCRRQVKREEGKQRRFGEMPRNVVVSGSG